MQMKGNFSMPEVMHKMCIYNIYYINAYYCTLYNVLSVHTTFSRFLVLIRRAKSCGHRNLFDFSKQVVLAFSS